MPGLRALPASVPAAPRPPARRTTLATTIRGLLQLLDLEPLEVALFRGRTPETWHQRVFGGQVAAQALVAAGRTVPSERPVHSLHAYFLRPGDPSEPILYQVDLIRDGRSFTTRRVEARQHGRPIFHLSASFQVVEDGFEHQAPMPDVPPPESLASVHAISGDGPGRLADLLRGFRAIDLRYVTTPRQVDADPALPGQLQIWMRAVEAVPDDPLLHVCVLAYLSDMTLLGSALVPHGLVLPAEEVQTASLDHAMWFHRPFRADDWLLYEQWSPSASGARGLASGRIFTRDGRLAVSVVQEGLIRPRTDG